MMFTTRLRAFALFCVRSNKRILQVAVEEIDSRQQSHSHQYYLLKVSLRWITSIETIDVFRHVKAQRISERAKPLG